MKKVNNPFAGRENYNCIGCSPDHQFGLKLNFYLDETKQEVFTEWEPNHNFEGYHNVLHGGIQATMLDEIASWAVYVLLKTGGVTSQLQVRYIKPVLLSEGSIRLTARIEKFEKRLANIKTQLINANGVVCSEGVVQYFVFPEAIAKEKYGYPGIEKFL
ncbi:MAG TPA: PaaI family thioesterase [Tenuifilaceae bacterium]|nr:PaaI family thioesterase [Tenuifilaceae bacterium]